MDDNERKMIDTSALKIEEKAMKEAIAPQERTRRAVHATGNSWAIENFNAVHN